MKIFYGIDLGSRFVKVAIDEETGYQFLGPYDPAGFYRRCVQAGPEGASPRRDILGLEEDPALACTGYGRARLPHGAGMGPGLETITARGLGPNRNIGCGHPRYRRAGLQGIAAAGGAHDRVRGQRPLCRIVWKVP